MNGQFKKTYLGNDTSFVRATANLAWSSGGDTLQLTGETSHAIFSAPIILGSTNVQGQEVLSFTTFSYESARTQSLFLGAADFTAINYSYSNLTFDGIGVNNNDTSNTTYMYAQVKFPDGVTLNNTVGIKAMVMGNGTSGIDFTLFYKVKPTTDGVNPAGTGATLLSATGNVANSFTVLNANYSSSHIVDNSPSGNQYVLGIILPIKISLAVPRFCGVTLQYLITNINN
jgi:hypothetical protein